MAQRQSKHRESVGSLRLMTWRELRAKQRAERQQYLLNLIQESPSITAAAVVAAVRRTNFYGLLKIHGIAPPSPPPTLAERLASRNLSGQHLPR